MGLDQYLYRLKGEITPEEYEEKKEKIIENFGLWTEKANIEIEKLDNFLNFKDIGYWRKYYKLDNCMKEIFHKNRTEEFNCKYLELDYENINYIIEIFKEDENIVKLMKQCLGYINKGYKIWYSNWY